MQSLSAQDPSKFYWMRYISERATTANNNAVRFIKGTLFGVREIKGKSEDEIMLIDGTTFRLPIAKSEVLMNRGKEYKGAIKLTAKVVPVAQVRSRIRAAGPSPVKVKAEPAKVDATAIRYTKLVKSVGGLTAKFITMAQYLKATVTLKHEDAIAFKKWVLTKVAKTDPVHRAILSVVLLKIPKIESVKPATKLVRRPEDKGSVRVKLSETDMPDEEDFTDYDVPAEFHRHSRVESSDKNWFMFVAESADLEGILPGTVEEFNQLVRKTLEPHVAEAKHALDAAVKAASAKIKAWAIVHHAQAVKLGTRTDLFEKLMNNPSAAAKQLALAMLGAKAGSAVSVKAENDKLDSLLSGIKL